MAVDVLCSETSSPSVISPRISFSHDLNEVDLVPVESLDHHPTIDFDFCVDQSFFSHDQISSADELFSDGRILPVQIKKALRSQQIHEQDEAVMKNQNPKKSNPANENPKKKRLIEFLSDEKKPSTKPFWQFRRSTSMNCENSRSGNNNNNDSNYGLLRTWNFLKRSNSTGSAPNPKTSALPSKSMKQQHSLKEGSINYRGNSTVNYQYNYQGNIVSKKPSLRKSMSSINRSYGNNGVGINISPVLNINPSCIAKGTVSLFGIGSFFCSKKSKKKRK